MKNSYIAKLLIIIISFLLVACTSKQPSKQYNDNTEQHKICLFPDNDTERAPIWVCGLQLNDFYAFAISNVKKSTTNVQNLLTQATSNAKIVIVQQMKTYVSNKVKNYVESNNLGGVDKFINISSIITSNITEDFLDRNTTISTATSKNGSVYVLVGLTKDAYQSTLKVIFKNTLENNKQDLEYYGIDNKKYNQLIKLIINV